MRSARTRFRTSPRTAAVLTALTATAVAATATAAFSAMPAVETDEGPDTFTTAAAGQAFRPLNKATPVRRATPVAKPTVRKERASRASTRRPIAARPAPAPRRDGLNWAALAECESGGNPRAVSPNGTYRGLYQFDLSTWRSVGGSGDPIDASSAEQTRRAQLLFAERGRSPWPVCGKRL